MDKKNLLLYFEDFKRVARGLSKDLLLEASPVKVHKFPDGESLVTLPETLPECVIIYQSLYNPNERLIELLFSAKGARELGAKRLILVSPYMCYMRQDKAFLPGQVVSQRVIGSFLAGLFDCIITVDAHLHRTPDIQMVFTGARAINLSAKDAIIEFIKKDFKKGDILLGPDEESRQWVGEIASSTGLSYGICKKIRTGDENVTVLLPEDLDFKGKRVIIIDDIISTGHTVAQTSFLLKGAGVSLITCIVTHAIFTNRALKVLKNAGVKRIYSTNSIPHDTNAIDITPILKRALKKELLI